MKKIAILLTAVMLLAGLGQVQAAEWKLDTAHSNIKFRVKHLGVSNVWGSFESFNGKVMYDQENPEAASVDVSVNISSIDTDNEKRDGHLLSPDFFDAETYPTMTFKSTSVKKVADGLKLMGNLTIHGVTKSVTLDVEGPSGPVDFMGTTKIAATATGTIDRRDYGLTWNKALETGGVLVGNEVYIVIETELDMAK